jgi:hypothetical protein
LKWGGLFWGHIGEEICLIRYALELLSPSLATLRHDSHRSRRRRRIPTAHRPRPSSPPPPRRYPPTRTAASARATLCCSSAAAPPPTTPSRCPAMPCTRRPSCSGTRRWRRTSTALTNPIPVCCSSRTRSPIPALLGALAAAHKSSASSGRSSPPTG